MTSRRAVRIRIGVMAGLLAWALIGTAAAFDLDGYRQRAASDRAAGIAEGRAALASGLLEEDPVALRTLLWHMGGAAVGAPDDEALAEVLAQLQRVADQHQDGVAESYAGFLRGARMIDLGRSGEGLIEALRAANDLSVHTDPRQRMLAATELCRVYLNIGQAAQALEHCHRHTQLLGEADSPTDLARAQYLEGIALNHAGRSDEAVTLLGEARQRFHDQGLAALAGRAAGSLAGVLVDLSRFDEAISLAEEAVAAAQQSNNAISLSIARSMLAEALAGAGELDRAASAIEAAIAGMDGLHQPGALSNFLHVQANILAARGQPAEQVAAVRARSQALRGEAPSSQQQDTVDTLEERFLQREQALRIRELEQENRSRQLELEAARLEAERQQQTLLDQRRIVLLSAIAISALAALLLLLALLLRAQRRLAAHLKEQAYRDALTTLPNRRAMLDRLEALLRDAPTAQPEHALIMLDIDHFKAVNDRHGHPFGDAVLAAVGRCLLDHQPVDGLVARLGGEEFLLLCPHIGGDGALALAERIRRAIATLRPGVDGQRIDLSASLGVALSDAATHGEPSDWIARADQALYRAKRAGRDRVELSGHG